MEQEHQFIDYIEQSIIKNWDKDSLTDYKGITLQYKDVARKIAKFHIVLESAGIQPGDKIAVCGRNSAHWAVTFLATITYGAVIVPILHEFKADNIHNIVNHSEAKLLFVGDQAWENLNEDAMPLLEGIASLTDFSSLVSRNEKLTYGMRYTVNVTRRISARSISVTGKTGPRNWLLSTILQEPQAIQKVSCSPIAVSGRMWPIVLKCFPSNRATISFPCFLWDTFSVWYTISYMASPQVRISIS